MNAGRLLAGPLATVFLFTAFLLPGIVNHHPILFPDSVGYFHSGEAVLAQGRELLTPARQAELSSAEAAPGVSVSRMSGNAIEAEDLKRRASDGVSVARSPFYGLFLVTLYVIGGQWLPVIVQIAIVLITLFAAMPHMGVSNRKLQLLIAGAVVMFGGLAIFATALMPDVFTGLLLLALAVLLARADHMTFPEQCWFLSVILIACLFHKAHVAIAVVLIAGFGLLSWLWDRQRLRAILYPSAAVLLALLGHWSVAQSVYYLTGRPPTEVPFLLARMVGDGTADRYLRAHCGETAPERSSDTMCSYVAHMPMSADEFLWSENRARGVWQLASPDEKAAISTESSAIVNGTIRNYPLEQAKASAGNALRQLFTVGITQFGNVAELEPEKTPGMSSLLTEYRGSAIWQRKAPLTLVSTAMLTVYSLALCFVSFALFRFRSGSGRNDGLVAIVMLLLAGLAINAAVSGVIAGVYDRYQGRVAWLSLLAALVLLSNLHSSVHTVTRNSRAKRGANGANSYHEQVEVLTGSDDE